MNLIGANYYTVQVGDNCWKCGYIPQCSRVGSLYVISCSDHQNCEKNITHDSKLFKALIKWNQRQRGIT